MPAWIRVVPLAVALLVATPASWGAGATTTSPIGQTTVAKVHGPLHAARTFALPRPATHVAVHWRGRPDAPVSVAFARARGAFGAHHRVRLDELGQDVPGNETYGAVMSAHGARFVRVTSETPLPRVSVLALTDGGGPTPTRSPSAANSLSAPIGKTTTPSSAATTASGGITEPPVIARSGWGADESLRFDASGNEIWPPAFYPVQKLIIHHTDTQNNDPNPAATIRSIYYYHAVTQGWGDIGYNFLIDEAGNIYEGRYSRAYAPGETPTGQDASGKGVTGAHAQGYNSGTVGVALLGTLTNQDATPAARDALERLLAWEADSHGIDPQGSALYTNPVSGTQATFANIAGHRDVAATECPGGAFYATLPTIRADVAGRIAGSQPPTTASYSPTSRTILAGSIYRKRGAASRLAADDGRYLEISSAASSSSYVADMYASATITADERSSLRRLTVDYDGNATRAAAAVTLQAYDWATASWTTLDGPRTGVTADRAFSWTETTAPADYASPTGEIRFRVRGTASAGFRTRTDLIRFTIDY